MSSEKKKVVRRVKAKSDTSSASSDATPKTVVRKKRVAEPGKKAVVDKKPVVQASKTASAKPATKKADTTAKTTKQVKVVKKTVPAKKKLNKKPFILFRPFVAFGHYVADSWRELRKVEWPSDRATWKMVLAIVIFCLIIGVFVLLCDNLFQWIIKEVIL